MGIKIYLDDTRFPPKGWLLVQTVPELITLVELIGEHVDEISLDHDLGTEKYSGYSFINWLEKKVVDGIYTGIPKLNIHSKNPVGRKNLETGIRRIWKHLEEKENG